MVKITQELEYTYDDIRRLTKGLDDHARLKRGYQPVEDFAIFMRDDNNEIVGGCNGLMYYGCLFIDQLWVDEQYRNQQYGFKLLQYAEELGKKNDCAFATLETMDWEALDFYKKYGYELEFERSGYLGNTRMFLLRKELN
jgi:ribosomal protein S18 acetylase RimI-like enzyme